MEKFNVFFIMLTNCWHKFFYVERVAVLTMTCVICKDSSDCLNGKDSDMFVVIVEQYCSA